MSSHEATITWKRGDAKFADLRYSREHEWYFDGNVSVRASASPHVVPLPYSVENAVDPEEAFVASLSSCHMLWFLSVAAREGFVVDTYSDKAVGRMGRNGEGKLAMLEVLLRPETTFSGRMPTNDQIHALHNEAHDSCFLASSVKTDVRCEPVHKF